MTALLCLLAPVVMAQDRMNLAGSLLCLQAAKTAEMEWGLPPGMLAAIGRVESGRWDSRTNQVEPWPWTVNAAGAGRYHPLLHDAVADVVREQAAGVRSVDVGCFQVNLLHHPTAFADLDEAFDPLANARYAARFLNVLRVNTGTWDLAVAQYHSAVPEIGEPYRQRVMAAWQGGASPAVMPMRASYVLAPQRHAAAGDPHVILVGASAAMPRGVQRGLPTDPHVIRVHG